MELALTSWQASSSVSFGMSAMVLPAGRCREGRHAAGQHQQQAMQSVGMAVTAESGSVRGCRPGTPVGRPPHAWPRARAMPTLWQAQVDVRRGEVVHVEPHVVREAVLDQVLVFILVGALQRVLGGVLWTPYLLGFPAFRNLDTYNESRYS